MLRISYILGNLFILHIELQVQSMHTRKLVPVFVVGCLFFVSLPLLASSSHATSSNGVCPDGMSQCSDDKTCCEREDGHYGCCPYPNAVCCPDKVHCCPYGSVCDVSSGACLRGNHGDPLSLYRRRMAVHSPNRGLQQRLDVMRVHLDRLESSPSAIPQKPSSATLPKRNICPDKMSECPEDATCCLLVSGQYGCCPYPHGVCCNDRLHCCPQGTTCHESQGACKRGNQLIPFIKPQLMATQDTIPSPEKKMYSKSPPTMSFPVGWKLCSYFNCLENEFCVQRDDRVRACCSLDEGENCPFLRNQVPECPAGSVFMSESKACVKTEVPPLSTNKKARVSDDMRPTSAGERCKENTCPSGGKYTCCQVEGPFGTRTGCCPVENGICCSHAPVCCPNGYLCSEGGNKQVTCTSALVNQQFALPYSGMTPRQGVEVPPLNLLPSVADVDKQTVNNHRNQTTSDSCRITCRKSNGDTLCCPHANGSCCPGGETCCPSHYVCSLDGMSCLRN